MIVSPKYQVISHYSFSWSHFHIAAKLHHQLASLQCRVKTHKSWIYRTFITFRKKFISYIFSWLKEYDSWQLWLVCRARVYQVIRTLTSEASCPGPGIHDGEPLESGLHFAHLGFRQHQASRLAPLSLARAVTSSTALLVDTVQNKQQGAPQRTTVRSLSVHCLSSGRNNLQHPYDVTDINNNHNKSEQCMSLCRPFKLWQQKSFFKSSLWGCI